MTDADCTINYSSSYWRFKLQQRLQEFGLKKIYHTGICFNLRDNEKAKKIFLALYFTQ